MSHVKGRQSEAKTNGMTKDLFQNEKLKNLLAKLLVG
jgi:hypothetical protein